MAPPAQANWWRSLCLKPASARSDKFTLMSAGACPTRAGNTICTRSWEVRCPIKVAPCSNRMRSRAPSLLAGHEGSKARKPLHACEAIARGEPQAFGQITPVGPRLLTVGLGRAPGSEARPPTQFLGGLSEIPKAAEGNAQAIKYTRAPCAEACCLARQNACCRTHPGCRLVTRSHGYYKCV